MLFTEWFELTGSRGGAILERSDSVNSEFQQCGNTVFIFMVALMCTHWQFPAISEATLKLRYYCLIVLNYRITNGRFTL